MKPRFVLFAVLAIACTIPVLADDCPPGASWCSGLYRYDGMGNIRAIGSDTYIYDTAGRLVSGTAEVQRGGTSRQDYTHDTFGNRTGAGRIPGSADCLGGCEQSPAIDPATNHITSNGALYDAAGNLIAIQNTVYGVTYSATYTYDAAGSLARATAGSDDRQFIYTADDERIATRNGQNWTWTVRDLDNKVLREFTSLEPNGQPGLPILNRQWSKDYIWRDGLLLASVVPTTPGASTTQTQHFHLDHLGTPRLVSNDAGVQIGIHAYYPFGAELNLSGETPVEPMKFTGHERDLLASNPNTLDYMHARYDMATMGRFLSVDPVMDVEKNLPEPQRWNRYAYVTNNPLKYVDPDGEERQIPRSALNWSPEQARRNAAISNAVGGFVKSLIYADELRDAFSGFGSAPWNEKLMGSVVGIIALADIASNAIAPEKGALGKGGAVMLGHFPEYLEAGARAGARTFNVPTAIWNKMDDAARWGANQKFLDRAISRGASLLLATDPSKIKAGSFLEREVKYLQSKGYKLVQDGDAWKFVK